MRRIHHLHAARLIRLPIHDAGPTSQTLEHTLSGGMHDTKAICSGEVKEQVAGGTLTFLGRGLTSSRGTISMRKSYRSDRCTAWPMSVRCIGP